MFTVKANDITVILRPWRPEDADALVKNANNKKIADNMRDVFPHPYTQQHAENFIDGVIAHDPVQIFAMEIDGEACGSTGIFPRTDIGRLNAELGYWLAEKHWGKGITTAVVKEMIRYGFEAWPVLTRIFAVPFPTNIASQKVLERAGMKLEAVIKDSIIKNGVVMDELVYCVRRHELINP